MIITLLGMSGAGKSYWSRKISLDGFEHVDADARIEQKLSKELNALGYKGINGVAEWMGQPHEVRYSHASVTYSNFENEVMQEILDELGTKDADKVIDTTGSVIYLPDAILSKLAKVSTMVYLHTPESAHDAMARQYLDDPKPVIWGDVFNVAPAETPAQAIARCYPKLLLHRTKKYQRLAHVTFDYDQLHNPSMSAHALVEAARSCKV